jgi:hypothetical protein
MPDHDRVTIVCSEHPRLLLALDQANKAATTGKVHRLTIVCGTEHLQWYMGPRVRKDDYSFRCGSDDKLWHARLFLYRTSLTNLAMLATTLSHARRHPPVMPGYDRVPIVCSERPRLPLAL